MKFLTTMIGKRHASLDDLSCQAGVAEKCCCCCGGGDRVGVNKQTSSFFAGTAAADDDDYINNDGIRRQQKRTSRKILDLGHLRRYKRWSASVPTVISCVSDYEGDEEEETYLVPVSGDQNHGSSYVMDDNDAAVADASSSFLKEFSEVDTVDGDKRVVTLHTRPAGSDCAAAAAAGNSTWTAQEKQKCLDDIEQSLTRLESILRKARRKLHHSKLLLALRYQTETSPIPVVKVMKDILQLEAQRERTLRAIQQIEVLQDEVKKTDTANALDARTKNEAEQGQEDSGDPEKLTQTMISNNANANASTPLPSQEAHSCSSSSSHCQATFYDYRLRRILSQKPMSLSLSVLSSSSSTTSFHGLDHFTDLYEEAKTRVAAESQLLHERETGVAGAAPACEGARDGD